MSRVFRLLIILSTWLLFWLYPLVSYGVAQAGGVGICDFRLVSKVRVNRLEYDYTFSASVANGSAADLQSFTATLVSPPAGMTVQDSSLAFALVPAGVSELAKDTFTFRQDRSYEVKPENLQWQLPDGSVISGAALCPAGVQGPLLLWNTLGSPAEVTNSVVGPSGSQTGGSFGPGISGNAYIAAHTSLGSLTFPASVLYAPKGTIEFWAKLIDFPANISNSGVELFTSYRSDHQPSPDLGFRLGFAENDGCGGGGVHGTVGVGINNVCGGVAHTATGNYGEPRTYDSILGVGKAAGWHHYALVWDQAGIPGIPGQRKVAVFVDGTFATQYYYQDFTSGAFTPIPSDRLLGLVQNNEGQGSVAIDNYKIWGFAKTDFSDRFKNLNPPSVTVTASNPDALWCNTTQHFNASVSDPDNNLGDTAPFSWTTNCGAIINQSLNGADIILNQTGECTVSLTVTDMAGTSGTGSKTVNCTGGPQSCPDTSTHWDSTHCVPNCPLESGTHWDGTQCAPNCTDFATYWNGSMCIPKCQSPYFWNGSGCCAERYYQYCYDVPTNRCGPESYCAWIPQPDRCGWEWDWASFWFIWKCYPSNPIWTCGLIREVCHTENIQQCEQRSYLECH